MADLPIVTDASESRWEDLDQRLLSAKLQDISEEMQRRSNEGERKAASDAQRSGNSAGYLGRLFDFQEALTDEWAERVYTAHREVWSTQNRVVTSTFIRAVRDRAVNGLIAVRKSTVSSGVALRGQGIGERPNPVALGEWNRRMDRLAAKWNRKLEAAAVEEGYRSSRALPGDDDRRFALLEIEEARKSVPENDGRPHPMVGAVVVKNGKVLAVAHRGEAEGNHAEYIALEKRLSDAAVAGSTVYTTLEPCTTRNHPKIPCADRLVERKVARVVMGMLDPDTRITGRGQRKLRKANIATDFFPHDLMAEVEDLNREFAREIESKDKAPISAAQPNEKATDEELAQSPGRHHEKIIEKLEDTSEGALVEIGCFPRQSVELPVPTLEEFLHRNRLQFSEAMGHFQSIDVFQNGVSVGYFPRGRRPDAKSTERFTLYNNGVAVFDALADTFLGVDRGLHAGWLSYELQRQLQLSKHLLRNTSGALQQISISVNFQNVDPYPLMFPSEEGQWLEHSDYAGSHEPIRRAVKLSEIHDHDSDKRNIAMAVVVDIMDEIFRIFGLPKARGLWDDTGKLTYVKGLENQR